MAEFNFDDAAAKDRMRAMFGPGQADTQIRQAIHMCWMMLPGDKKTVAEVEQQFRRLVDRALKDLREDAEAFGLGK